MEESKAGRQHTSPCLMVSFLCPCILISPSNTWHYAEACVIDGLKNSGFPWTFSNILAEIFKFLRASRLMLSLIYIKAKHI